MSRIRIALPAFALLLSLTVGAMAADKKPAFTDPTTAGPDFLVQGEYVGQVDTDDGRVAYGAQIIALGDGKFRAVGYRGGLPGAGWDKSERTQADGQTKDGVTTFVLPDDDVSIVVKDGTATVKAADGKTIGTFKKTVRKSPTLGAKPPAGALILFDGTSADNFKGRMTEDGLLMQGATGKQALGDHTLHLEFLLPFMPYSRGQGRGNSGLYVQSRYEVQMLDSFGLDGKDNECGGIYKVGAPAVNMCLPPLSWQTFDVDFTAAKYKDGKKVKNARITVRHNGVVVHDDKELPNATPGCKPEAPQPAPIFLQNHGNPVRYRNIWAVEKK